ncbi:unnamed protein product [Rotaria socialis]|uniref:Uncharacterized protein n=1 Tax=Rotaria socialis TaxID=392032 RepID=A0A818JKQ9_9BILA|nr:unnamed protein product [Rotaria socialis]
MPEYYTIHRYVRTVYLSFTFGIPSQAKPLFNLPGQWPSFCGLANVDFSMNSRYTYVVTPDGQDHFMLKLSGQPINFKVQPDWCCNAKRCVQFNSIVFDRADWGEQKQVDMSFGNYGCCSQRGFPEQFQATLNITSLQQYPLPTLGLQQLLYDYTNSRVRFDIKGWFMKQNETYMVQYKPKGAEADTPPSKGFTMFNFNPDYPDRTKNNCWYRTNPMKDAGPFPIEWYGDGLSLREVQRWFPLPSDLINKGEEWVPEIQGYAVRYDSPEMCDLKKSGIGLVPCLSYFEAPDRPVKSIEAHVGRTAYDYDEYLTTVYLSFTNGITPEAEHLFDLPNQWFAYCGNADTGFNVEPFRNFVVTPDGKDNLKLTLQAPPVHAPTDRVTIELKAQPNYFYNGTRCAEFSKVVFDKTNWQVPQQITMSFVDYGCCSYAITGNGGGYDWQYTISTVVVYACDGEAGVACKGKYTCEK